MKVQETTSCALDSHTTGSSHHAEELCRNWFQPATALRNYFCGPRLKATPIEARLNSISSFLEALRIRVMYPFNYSIFPTGMKSFGYQHHFEFQWWSPSASQYRFAALSCVHFL
eukprot:s2_g29.t1